MKFGDPVFNDAVAAIDAGDTAALNALLVAGNPVRNDWLPASIIEALGVIVRYDGARTARKRCAAGGAGEGRPLPDAG